MSRMKCILLSIFLEIIIVMEETQTTNRKPLQSRAVVNKGFVNNNVSNWTDCFCTCDDDSQLRKVIINFYFKNSLIVHTARRNISALFMPFSSGTVCGDLIIRITFGAIKSCA